MYCAGKKLLYHFFVRKAKFLQEWAMAININVHADCGRSGPVLSLHEASSKNIHIHLIMPPRQKKTASYGWTQRKHLHCEIQKLTIGSVAS